MPNAGGGVRAESGCRGSDGGRAEYAEHEFKRERAEYADDCDGANARHAWRRRESNNWLQNGSRQRRNAGAAVDAAGVRSVAGVSG